MHILFLSQVLPYPLDAGPKVRSYHVLRYLASKHQVTLVAFTRSTDTAQAAEHLRSFCHAVHTMPIPRSRTRDAANLATSILRGRSFLVQRDDLRPMDALLRQLCSAETFDAVHADQLSMTHYALRLPVPFKVFDAHNAMWLLIRRLAETTAFPLRRRFLEREARLLRALEAELCSRFDRVVTVTAEDRVALTFSHPPPRAPLTTIPICIDPDQIQPLAFNPKASDLICVGGMFYPPNVDGVLWFADRVLPRVWAVHPNLRFRIVGTRPAPALVALAQREPRCLVTGYVADTTPLMAQSAAFVVPLLSGGGMRVKILDTWAQQLPIVTTSIGCEGIEATNGENLLIADSPADVAAAVVRLVEDRALAQRLAEQGRAWVTQRYDWHTRYREWDAVYSD